MGKDENTRTQSTESEGHAKSKSHRRAEQGRLLQNILPIIIIILLIITVINSLIISMISASFEKTISAAREETRPANLEITKISFAGCADCYDIDSFVDGIRLKNVNITKEVSLDSSSDVAKSLIQNYGIKRLPTVLVSGELTKSAELKTLWSGFGDVKGGVFVLTKQTPAYYDIDKARVVGIVNATIISDKTCSNCSNTSLLVDSLRSGGVKINLVNNIDYNSTEGSQLIKKYSITNVPTLLLSEDAGTYDIVSQAWDKVGTIESGTYVFRKAIPPYRNLTVDQIQGMVSAIYLKDNSCTACYNVSTHNEILKKGFGVFISNETTYDINSTAGKLLLTKYNITLVPTVIVSPDAQYYATLNSVWPQVGTVESDGWYVFRNLTVLGAKYKDVATGQILGGS